MNILLLFSHHPGIVYGNFAIISPASSSSGDVINLVYGINVSAGAVALLLSLLSKSFPDHHRNFLEIAVASEILF